MTHQAVHLWCWKKLHNIHVLMHLKQNLKAGFYMENTEPVYLHFPWNSISVIRVSSAYPSHTAMLCVWYYQSKSPGSDDSDKFLVKADSGHAAFCPNHTATPPCLLWKTLPFIFFQQHFLEVFSLTMILIHEGFCSVLCGNIWVITECPGSSGIALSLHIRTVLNLYTSTLYLK